MMAKITVLSEHKPQRSVLTVNFPAVVSDAMTAGIRNRSHTTAARIGTLMKAPKAIPPRL